MNAAQAFIAFLHCEATQAEERAKSLRATAATIEANSNEGQYTQKDEASFSNFEKAMPCSLIRGNRLLYTN